MSTFVIHKTKVKMKNLFLLLTMIFVSPAIFGQGVTTASLGGSITNQEGETLIGVNVTAIHTPTGTFYGSSSDALGNYRMDNMKVGGPYSVTISYVGYGDVVGSNIFLRLGEKYSFNAQMGEGALQLDEVVVYAKAGSVGKNSGSSTQISTEDIEDVPTLNRNITDYLRLTPQASTTGSGISFAGTNNRFNAIYVDGAVNNDVFGLAGSGTNGGQTGISPFSIDIIDQFQVVLSPYDVTLGGFSGGGINAVTKSGKNDLFGTAYYFLQNENMVGKTNGELIERLGLTADDREKVDEFSKTTYGASLGGPIVKDKAFFFVNAELQNDQTPIPFDPTLYTNEAGRASIDQLNQLTDKLINQFGYDPGTFGDTSDELEGLKLFGKIDINLNRSNQLTLRHQYTKAEQFNRSGGSSRSINFSNNGVFFPSVTNSSAIELNTTINSSMSNNLILGYTSVNDDRDPLGDPFPFVIIGDGSGTINFGGEPFSSANVLEQKIFTLTDNFKLYKGKHTFTFGTHNEFYSIRNVFLPWNFGQYEFDSLDDFLNDAPADSYRRVYSLVDEIAGDETAASAEFSAMQLGVYAQDEIEVSNKLTVTAGLRIDVPILSDDPEEAPRFNDEVLPRLETQYEVANNVRAGQAPDGQIMLSPRVGFTYKIDDTNKSTLRGGVGLFTSRIPFVWPGAMYNTNGLTSTFLGDFAIPGDVNFIPGIQDQYTFENPTVPSGDMNLFVDDFKYPQVLRGNLAWDKEFGDGWVTSFEGIYTKTLNNVNYQNINTSTEVDFTWTGSGDDRPVFVGSEIDEDEFGAVYVGSNTSQGYTYNLTASVAKSFHFGLDASLAYSYNDAKSLSEGTSSQNSSQWRGQVHISDRNDPLFGRSDFSSGHRILSTLNYGINWGGKNNIKTTFSVLYTGQSGTAFTYVIGSRDARNIGNQRGSTSRNRSVVYVPQDAGDINLVDYMDGDQLVTAAEQWENLNTLIESDSGLSSRRGDYAEKNGSRAPWTNFLDFAIRQDLGTNLGGNLHRIQLSLDIFNVANLINKNWGVRYNVPGDFNNFFLYDFEGYEADETTPQFTYRESDTGNDRFDVSNLSSRWSMRLGVRYIFGD